MEHTSAGARDSRDSCAYTVPDSQSAEACCVLRGCFVELILLCSVLHLIFSTLAASLLTLPIKPDR
jgi:hypothetical protein